MLPVSAEDLKDIKIGDIVWLDGDLMTCRDVAHRRLVEYGRELPYDIKDKAIFMQVLFVRKIEGRENDYEMVSVGAVAERINGIIKAESSHPRGRFNDIGHARNVIYQQHQCVWRNSNTNLLSRQV